jgi:hypothetical protein
VVPLVDVLRTFALSRIKALEIADIYHGTIFIANNGKSDHWAQIVGVSPPRRGRQAGGS